MAQPLWRQLAQRVQRCLPRMGLGAVLMQQPEGEVQQMPHFVQAQRALMQTAAARCYWQTRGRPGDQAQRLGLGWGLRAA